MNYIENIYICLTAPLLVAIICLKDSRRRVMIFLLAGMSACLLSSYISTFIALSYGVDKLNASIEIVPTIEELMKLFPMLFYLLVLEPKKEDAVGSSLVIAVGFATFENVCFLLENDASNITHLLIKGFGTGTMHVMTGVIVSGGVLLLWNRAWLKPVGVLALLGFASVFHAVYNILVSQSGVAAYVGYSIPMAAAIFTVIFKNRILAFFYKEQEAR